MSKFKMLDSPLFYSGLSLLLGIIYTISAIVWLYSDKMFLPWIDVPMVWELEGFMGLFSYPDTETSIFIVLISSVINIVLVVMYCVLGVICFILWALLTPFFYLYLLVVLDYYYKKSKNKKGDASKDDDWRKDLAEEEEQEV